MIFIFRRDFRTTDNHALAECCKAANNQLHQLHQLHPVIPIFILNSKQTSKKQNTYYSERAFRFMMRSLAELQRDALPDLRVYKTTGKDTVVLSKILKEQKIHSVYFNADYTPFAKERDAAIKAWCDKNKIECVMSTSEYSLVDPSTMVKPYQRFTPFYNKYSQDVIPKVQMSAMSASVPCALAGAIDLKPYLGAATATATFGLRQQALAIVERIRSGDFVDYEKTREDLGNDDGTSHLSPHLKFGTVSLREVFHASTNVPSLTRQLFWRAFYDQIAYHFPRVLDSTQNQNQSLNLAYDEKYKNKWKNSPTDFKKWQQGKTGVPLVDAAMRQLAKTGYMHNRARMVVASYLVKDLEIDWRWGERYFAQQLIDYHPSANSGGWQWVSGGGSDPQQAWRKFSPERQAKRYDPLGNYVANY
jgi:deoxyribodipyrimidine photo-lyase